MKKIFLSIIALVVSVTVSALSQAPKASQPAKHKVVFQMNSPAPNGWDQLFRNVDSIRETFGKDGIDIEIVFFGKGLPMLLKTNAQYADRLKDAASKGVVLAACQNTMRQANIKSEDLFPFSTEVDSGVAELIRKQEAGYSYIKSGE